MRTGIRMVIVATSLAVAPIALAQEVVYFKNGTFMTVQAHQVEGDMVRLRLDGNASMSFPSLMVEKIESAAGIVFGAGTLANQALPRLGSNTPYPVTGNAAVGMRNRRNAESEPQAPPPPPTMRPDRALSGRGAVDSISDGVIMQSIRPGPSGTRQIGNKFVIDANPLSEPKRFKPQRFGLKPEKPALNPENPPPPPTQEEPATESPEPDGSDPGNQN